MTAAPSGGCVWRGVCAAPGFAEGPVAALEAPAAAARTQGDPAAEAAALRAAMDAAAGRLASLAEAQGGEAAEVLGFQVALLEDEELAAPALAAIAGGAEAGAAWAAALDAMAADYAAAEDAYFRARAADIADLRDAVAAALSGGEGGAEPPLGAIVLADDMPPSRFLARDWSGGGLALRRGSERSHVAMLARARGVPMVVGLGDAPVPCAHALLDAGSGALTPAPSDAARAAFAVRRGAAADEAARDAAAARLPAVTAAGEPVAVLVNVASVTDLDALDPATCDGIGLARTELMLDGSALTDEAAQFAAYARLVTWAQGRPVTVRTLDAGGDKPIPGYTLEGEANPFLGQRGVRLSLARHDVFAVQLRALMRAAALGPLQVMLPMVATPAELSETRALMAEEAECLAARGVPHAMPPLGIMVETPAAAYGLPRFRAAFASIGSNDLAQYVMAAARDEAAVAHLARADDPAVLHAIAAAVAGAREAGVPLSICGDAAGDPAVIPHLLAAGLRSLSVASSAIGRTKRAVAAWGAPP